MSSFFIVGRMEVGPNELPGTREAVFAPAPRMPDQLLRAEVTGPHSFNARERTQWPA